MYFVNRSEIEERISHIDKLLNEIKKQETFSNAIEELALERAIHVIIEAMLDVGNSMIDGFIMRDPGSYHDIIDILLDEKVIPEEDESGYKALIDLRQILVQKYLTVDHQQLKDVLFTHMNVLQKFSSYIRTYLDNELGVANAFSNES
ncbi:MAG TPA: DUF86 domain-containing protein [Pseudogracilibacillus sp.]|nr:DUF86 domain-containing protein [Pseudogracilibacillus sp.]